MADAAKTTEAPKLTGKQKLFVDSYVGAARGNAVEAARMAGYSGSYSTIASTACDNLKKANIREAIEARTSEFAMTAEEVLTRLSEHARGDLGLVLEHRTYGKPVIDISEAVKQGKTHLIRKYSVGPKGVEIELYDAQAALVQLGKYHRLFVERTENTHEHDFSDYAGRILSKLFPELTATGETQADGSPDRAGTPPA